MRTRQKDHEKRARIAQLLRHGLSGVVICERLGCSDELVTRVKRELKAEQQRTGSETLH